MRRSLKNYRSELPVERIVQNIQTLLAHNGTENVTIEYFRGAPVAVRFIIKTPRGPLQVKLPTRIEKVSHALYGRDPHTEKERQQIWRTGWKNIHDWIDAQLALVATEMVKLEEVFLPYMEDGTGVTFFERMEERGFLLPSGKS